MQESEEEAKPSGFWTLKTDVKYNRRSWRDLPGLCLHVRPVDLHQCVACGAKLVQAEDPSVLSSRQFTCFSCLTLKLQNVRWAEEPLIPLEACIFPMCPTFCSLH